MYRYSYVCFYLYLYSRVYISLRLYLYRYICIYVPLYPHFYLPIYIYTYLLISIYLCRCICTFSFSTVSVYFYISISLCLYPYIISYYIISVGICRATGQACRIFIPSAILVIFGGFFPHPARPTPPLFAGEFWKCRKRKKSRE